MVTESRVTYSTLRLPGAAGKPAEEQRSLWQWYKNKEHCGNDYKNKEHCGNDISIKQMYSKQCPIQLYFFAKRNERIWTGLKITKINQLKVQFS